MVGTGAYKRYEPYRYYKSESWLKSDLYNRLVDQRPPWLTVADIKGVEQPNARADLSFNDMKEGGRYQPSEDWRKFLDFCVSHEFYRRICDLLTIDYIDAEKDYQFIPRAEKSKNSLPRVNMDCQIGINTPNTGTPARVRGPHVDFPGQLWGGMLYMPVEGDTDGGDLIIYESTVPDEDLRFHGKAELTDDQVREVDRVPYAPNTAIFWENSVKAIHGVDIRQTSDKPRQMVNFIAEVQEQRFDLPKGK